MAGPSSCDRTRCCCWSCSTRWREEIVQAWGKKTNCTRESGMAASLPTGLFTVSERVSTVTCCCKSLSSFYLFKCCSCCVLQVMYSVTSSCWWEFCSASHAVCFRVSTVLLAVVWIFPMLSPRDSHVWSHLFWLLWSIIINSVPGSRGGLRSQDAFLHGITVDDRDNILDTLNQSICADFFVYANSWYVDANRFVPIVFVQSLWFSIPGTSCCYYVAGSKPWLFRATLQGGRSMASVVLKFRRVYLVSIVQKIGSWELYSEKEEVNFVVILYRPGARGMISVLVVYCVSGLLCRHSRRVSLSRRCSIYLLTTFAPSFTVDIVFWLLYCTWAN
jgi:hypothetical protein